MNSNKAKKKSLLKYLLSFAGPHLRSLVIALFFVGVSTVLNLVNPYVVKIAIDEYISGDIIKMVEVDSETEMTLELNGKYYERLPEEKRNDDSIKDTYTIGTEDGIRYLIKNGERIGQIPSDVYRAYRQNDINSIVRITVVFIVVVLSSFCATWIYNFILGRTGGKIIYDIRRRTFEHIVKQSHSYFNGNAVGRLMTRVTSDTQSLNEFYSSVMVSFIADLGIVIGIIVMMIKLNLNLASYTLALIPAIGIISFIYSNMTFAVWRKVRSFLSMINTSLNEYLSGMSIIKIFGKERKIFNKFDYKNSTHRDLALTNTRTRAIFRPTLEMVKNLGQCLIMYYGGGKVIQGHIEFGTLFLFITYLNTFFRPILDISEKYNILQLALASVEKISDILETDTEIKPIEEYKSISVPSEKGDIEFKNVHFSYVPDEPVLKDINFKIKKGEAVAFVGATGAGKTSILSLLARFYDINSGNIFIDGRDIRGMSTDELRHRIGFVLQDVFLFSGDIKYNITLGRKYSNDETITAAKRVHADEFIRKLNDGYDTEVNERGTTLSSGERQLLSFARTILRDPEILILDEATSSIDTETERLIQKGLEELMKNRTTIAIAHRLSTIKNMDRIIVMKHGRIVETGSHDELMERQGYYYKLYQLQQSDENNN